FAQALIAGLAITRLRAMCAWTGARLWSSPNFLGALAVAIAAMVFAILALDAKPWAWGAAALALLAFAFAASERQRSLAVIALCAILVVDLFFAVGGTYLRPALRPEIYHTHDALFARLREDVGTGRIYLSPNLSFVAGLTAKQGTLQRVRVSTDYEPLVSARYAQFLLAVTPAPRRSELDPFAGWYFLDGDTNWNLVDLTAARFFVMSRDEPGAAYMRRRPAKFRSIHAQGWIQVFERLDALPRAYYVSTSQVLEDGDQVLAAISHPAFDPRHEVVLEGQGVPIAGAPTGVGQTRVEILRDDPEQVVVAVSAPAPGHLVLSDAYDPDWHAFVAGREVTVRRANHLFRAVEVGAGLSEIRFVYQPRGFQVGSVVGGVTVGVLAGGLALGWLARVFPAGRHRL
ncbi:MAG: YfhO family protein, partial [bacterium]|nr:YfhO family protein [bacterium]